MIGVKDILLIHEHLMKKHNINLSYKEKKRKEKTDKTVLEMLPMMKKRKLKNMIKSTIKS